jgi:hypothetical protein
MLTELTGQDLPQWISDVGEFGSLGVGSVISIRGR